MLLRSWLRFHHRPCSIPVVPIYLCAFLATYLARPSGTSVIASKVSPLHWIHEAMKLPEFRLILCQKNYLQSLGLSLKVLAGVKMPTFFSDQSKWTATPEQALGLWMQSRNVNLDLSGKAWQDLYVIVEGFKPMWLNMFLFASSLSSCDPWVGLSRLLICIPSLNL